MASIKKNFIYNSLYQVLLVLLPLITAPYISRILSPSGIGIYSYSYSIASYFVLFIMLGLNNYGNRTVAIVREDKHELSKTFWGIYIMQICCGILCVMLYILFCVYLSDNLMISMILLSYVISSLFDINWLFFGLEKFKLTVIRSTLVKIITVIMIFIFVKKADDIYLYALIMGISILISQLLLWPFIFKEVSFISLRKNDIIKHIKPNLILFIPVIAISLYKTMDKIMLGAMTNMSEVGFYENAEKIINIPMGFITALGTVMLPKMSNLVAKKNKNESDELIRKSLGFALFISSSMVFGLLAISNEFIPFFYGDGYDKCIILLYFLLPSTIFVSWANVIRTQILIPTKKDKVYLISVCFGALVNLMLNFILIPMYMSLGATTATFVAEIIVCIYQSMKIGKVIPLRKYFMESIHFVIIGIIMYLFLLAVPSMVNNLITIIVKVIIGSFVYLSLSALYYKVRKNRN